jgi:polyribonucleotide nucleotidyltransferase
MVLSTDNQNDPDLLAVIGSSACLAVGGVPCKEPIGAARIGFRNGEYIVYPTHDEMDECQMLLTVCGPKAAPNMIEMEGKEISEEVVAVGIEKAHEVCQLVIEAIEELVALVKPKLQKYEAVTLPEELVAAVMTKFGKKIEQAKQIVPKLERADAMEVVRQEALAELSPEGAEEPLYSPGQVKEAFYKVEGKIQRKIILAGKRPDGRARDQVRPLGIEVGVLPRTHGSAIFSRGETQALVSATLGTPRDEQIIDGLLDEYKKRFMLHYNFPPFCVGEIKPIRGPGRREIGHGALAEKSIEAVMPELEVFPYTVRIVADMMESNGSTSMATPACRSRPP